MSILSKFEEALKILKDIHKYIVLSLYRENQIMQELDKLLSDVSAQGGKLSTLTAEVAKMKADLTAAVAAAGSLSDADKKTLEAIIAQVAVNDTTLEALVPTAPVVAPPAA